MTRRYVYLRLPTLGGFEKLYDRRQALFQADNVAGELGYAQTLSRMRNLWERYRSCSGATGRATP